MKSSTAPSTLRPKITALQKYPATAVQSLLLLILSLLFFTPTHAQTVVMDSIAMPDYATAYTVSATEWRGPVFQTGTDSTKISEVSFRLIPAMPTMAATLSLYRIDNATDLPLSPAITSTTITVIGDALATNTLNTFSAAQLGSIANEILLPGQKYALILSNPNSSSSYLGLVDNDSPGGAFTFGGGFSAVSSGYIQTFNSGSLWAYNPSVTPAFQLKVVIVPPTPPVLAADAKTVSRTQSSSVDVLANDGAGLTLDTAYPLVLSNSAAGSLAYVGSQIQFTPTSNFTGPVTFQYQACTAQGACATATVTLTPQLASTAVPTLSQWGLAIMSLLLGLFAAARFRNGPHS